MLEQVMPPPCATTRIVLCGPQGFMDTISSLLLSLGHTHDAVIELKAAPRPEAKRDSQIAASGVRILRRGEPPGPAPSINVRAAPDESNQETGLEAPLPALPPTSPAR